MLDTLLTAVGVIGLVLVLVLAWHISEAIKDD